MPIGGVWYNELGSTMILQQDVPAQGLLTGTYQSGVGTSGLFGLVGSYDANENTLGFAVTWNNGTVDRASTTTWCGQYFNIGGETLITMWLLCETTAETNTWQSTLVGQDQFSRTPPSAEEIDAKRALRAPAHPRALDAS
jgi:hypothetical protein